MFERLISDAAALLSFDTVRVADPNWLPGLVVVAVKLALDLSDVTVRPISTSAESAMPARRVVDLRICSFLSSPPHRILPVRAAGMRELSAPEPAGPSLLRVRLGPPLV